MSHAGAVWILRENAAGASAVNPATQTVAAAIAWMDALEGLDPVDCVQAIRSHRARSPFWTWLAPCAVRELVEAAS